MSRRPCFGLAASLLALLAPSVATAQHILVRAGLWAPPAAQAALAEVAEPMDAPVKAGRAPDEVARELCGAASASYLDLLRAENGGGADVLAVAGVDRTLKFPACFYMTPEGPAVRAAGETLTEFTERVIGPSGPKTQQALRELNGPLETSPSPQNVKLVVPYSSRPVVYRLKPEAADNPQAAVDKIRDAFPGAYSAVELSGVASAEPGDLRPMNGILKRRKVMCDRTGPALFPNAAWPVDVAEVSAALARNAAWRNANNLPPATALVAVADNGIDLANNVFAETLLAPNANEPKNNADDDGNQKTDDIIGHNLYADEPPALAPLGTIVSHGHGTLMTSAALGGPTLSAAAVAQGWSNVRVLVISMVQRRQKPGSVTYGYPATGLAEALRYAQYRGAHVLNFSVGTDGLQKDFEALMLQPNPQRVIVAAAGNEAREYAVSSQYPAAYGGLVGAFASQVLTVAAHDQWGCLADFSGRGQSLIDIAAPGVAFPATGPKGRLEQVEGTSQAAALTSYAIGQMKAEGLVMGSRAKDRLYATARRSPQLAPYVASGGVLEVAQAISVHHDILKTTTGGVEYGVLAAKVSLPPLCPDEDMAAAGDVLRVDTLAGGAQLRVLWRTGDGRRSVLPLCTPTTLPPAFEFTPEGGARRTIAWTEVEYLIPH